MKKFLLSLIAIVSVLVMVGCDKKSNPAGHNTNSIVGQWEQNITQAEHEQTNIWDFKSSGILESTETVTMKVSDGITYEGAALDAYMDSIGRTNPNHTTDYWKTLDTLLIISKNSDFSNADTGTYLIEGDELTINYGSFSFSCERVK